MKRITYFIFILCCSMGKLSATTFSVQSGNLFWTPNTLNISVGDVAAFTNLAGTHNVQWLTAPAGALPTNSVNLSATPVNYTFNTAGTYTYQCGVHFALMTGSITVGTLPVELRSFAVEPKANGLLLKWLTESEANTSVFSVERAQLDSKFQEIGTVKAAGNSNKPMEYALEDATPPVGTLYYRLKTVDLDGSFKYSSLISIEMVKAYDVKIYPNPTSHIVSFEWFIPDSHQFELNIVDLSGRVVAGPFEQHEHHGLSRFDLDVSTFAAGKYIAILNNHQNFQQPLSFVVNH